MNQLIFVSNKATPHKIHYTHHTHPSFILRLKYPQMNGPCLKNMNMNISKYPLQVDEITNQVANLFRSEGVRRGDHLGLLMDNRPQVVFYWLGLTKLGAVTALINNNQRTSVLSHSISAGGFTRIICGTELLHGNSTCYFF
jgi:hypothetical protein